MLYHLYVNIQMFFFFFVYIYIYIVSWICKQIRLFTMHRLCQCIVDNAHVIYVFDIYIYIYIQCVCEDITIKAIKASLFMYLMSL